MAKRTATAPRWAEWEVRGKRASAPSVALEGGAAAIPGVPILRNTTNTVDVRVSVQVAWGAAVSADQSTWLWSDISHDVEYKDGITMQIGRADQSTTPQPCSLSFTLKNKSGAYSYGPQSSNYPNVTRNVPIRVIVYYNGTAYLRMLAYSTGFNPSWDTTGNYAVVKVTAAGAKRRLGKGQTPVQSVLARSIPSVAGLVEYWPMEDGTTSTSLASGIPGGTPMLIGNGIATGAPQLAASTAIASSNAIPVLATGSLVGPTAPFNTGTFQVRFMAVWPPAAQQAADSSEIMSINTPGAGISFWWLLYHTGGGISLQGHAANGAVVYDSGTISFGAIGASQLFSVAFVQSGSNITVYVYAFNVVTQAAGGVTLTVPGQTLNVGTYVCFAPNGDQTNLAIGHCTISNTYLDIFNLYTQVLGYVGEYTSLRMDRLAAENGEFLARIPGAQQQMGPQTPDTYLNLMEGCTKVENAYLYDGMAQGLSFIPQDPVTSQPASLTLDMAHGQMAPSLTPIDDDQLLINTYTTQRVNGSQAVAVASGPLSPANVGTYPDSTRQNFLQDGAQLTDYSTWKVNEGTTQLAYRWPGVELWMHRTPSLVLAWLNTRLLSRIDVINIGSIRGQLYNVPISLLLQGYTERIDQFEWSVTANTTAYDPWEVGIIAQETGDTGEFVMRLESDGASVATGVSAGASSISVSSVDTLWTTLADDFPFYANIGGQRVSVTNITGASSPQTFTVDPTTVLYPIAAGAAVTLWSGSLVDMIAF